MTEQQNTLIFSFSLFFFLIITSYPLTTSLYSTCFVVKFFPFPFLYFYLFPLRFLITAVATDPMYLTIEESALTAKASSHKPKYCKALFAYEAQGEQEISFVEGDMIEYMFEEDDVWWCGTINGKRGMFPNTFVKKMF